MTKLEIKPGPSQAIDGIQKELNYAADMIGVAKQFADRAKDSPEAMAQVVKIVECCQEAMGAIYRSGTYAGSLRAEVFNALGRIGQLNEAKRSGELSREEFDVMEEEEDKTKH